MPADPETLPSAVQRLQDRAAIQDLAVDYAYAVDDQDWERWRSLFSSDAHVDYASSGGIAGSRDEIVAWFPQAMSVFRSTMHTATCHEIRFIDDDHAVGRVHLFNRNELSWDGVDEVLDISGIYEDKYEKVDGRWRFTYRREDTVAIVGGAFAEMLRGIAAKQRAAAQ